MEKARVIFVDCPEHLTCLAAMCFEPIAQEEHDRKVHRKLFGLREPLNVIQWPWAKEWIREHPGYALQWVNHNLQPITPEQVVATTDWTPETQVVLDARGGRTREVPFTRNTFKDCRVSDAPTGLVMG